MDLILLEPGDSLFNDRDGEVDGLLIDEQWHASTSTFGKCIALLSFHPINHSASSMKESSNDAPSENLLFTELIFEKYVDRTSVNLLSYCLAAKPLGNKEKPVKLHRLCEYSGSTRSVITFAMRDVLISNMQIQPSPSGQPVEQLSLNFTEILCHCTTLNAAGETMNDFTRGWSATHNHAISAFT